MEVAHWHYFISFSWSSVSLGTSSFKITSTNILCLSMDLFKNTTSYFFGSETQWNKPLAWVLSKFRSFLSFSFIWKVYNIVRIFFFQHDLLLLTLIMLLFFLNFFAWVFIFFFFALARSRRASQDVGTVTNRNTEPIPWVRWVIFYFIYFFILFFYLIF